MLVVIDGIRWQEVFRGSDPRLGATRVAAEELVPNLWRLTRDGGAVLGAPGHGAEIRASGPGYKSMPGYREIMSGRAQSCMSNQCEPFDAPTLADELAAAPGAVLGDVAVFASWVGLREASARSLDRIVLSAGRREGSNLDCLRQDAEAATLLEAGERASSPIKDASFRRDRHTAALAVRWLVARKPRLLVLSLGESDEYAHAKRYARYLQALSEADRVVGDIARTLDAFAADGWPATLIVTTDHGRDRTARHHGPRWPESARTWLFARGAGITARGYASAPRRRNLADIAPTLRELLGLSPATAGGGHVLSELIQEPADPGPAAQLEQPARGRLGS